MKTEILFILDRSTSMGNVAGSAVEGFNAFLAEQQKKSKGKRLTLLQFDDKLEYIYKSQKIKHCKPLVLGETYIIQGCTALLDAIGTGLNGIRKAKNAIVTIYTDGQENMSREFTPNKVKKALARAERKGFEVIYLASDVNTTDYAQDALGFKANKVAFVNKGDFLQNMRTVSTYTTEVAFAGASGMASNNLQDDLDKDAGKTGSAPA